VVAAVLLASVKAAVRVTVSPTFAVEGRLTLALVMTGKGLVTVTDAVTAVDVAVPAPTAVTEIVCGPPAVVHRYVKLLLVGVVVVVVTSAVAAATVSTAQEYTRLLVAGDAAVGEAVSTTVSPSTQDVGAVARAMIGAADGCDVQSTTQHTRSNDQAGRRLQLCVLECAVKHATRA
jgi:hypothetical protein